MWIVDDGEEEIKCKTFAKRLPLLCSWMSAIVSWRKAMHKLINRKHRCNRGSSLIEWSTGAHERQHRCSDSSQGELGSTTNEENPPLRCSPVIVVSVICPPPASCLEKKKGAKKTVLSNHLAPVSLRRLGIHQSARWGTNENWITRLGD